MLIVHHLMGISLFFATTLLYCCLFGAEQKLQCSIALLCNARMPGKFEEVLDCLYRTVLLVDEIIYCRKGYELANCNNIIRYFNST